MNGTRKRKMKKQSRVPLVFSVIEELRRKGYNQSQIAEMHGVTRQAVSWQKQVYGGMLTPRQIVQKSWPWATSTLHGKSAAFQRLRDHGEFMATGGEGMSKLNLGDWRRGGGISKNTMWFWSSTLTFRRKKVSAHTEVSPTANAGHQTATF
jgi:hypothetical protein